MNLTEITQRAGMPKWEHDTAQKVYVVFDELGREQARFPYKDIWNSSPAMKDADKEVNRLKAEMRNREKVDWENRPLSKNEIEYQELDRKCKKYMATIRSGALDDETKAMYYEQATVWSDRMSALIAARQVRDSVVMGTYKPTS